MNLDLPGTPHTMPLAPEGWTMDLEEGGQQQYVGIVKRFGAQYCRLSVTANDLTEERARSRLADLARVWIGDYLNR